MPFSVQGAFEFVFDTIRHIRNRGIPGQPILDAIRDLFNELLGVVINVIQLAVQFSKWCRNTFSEILFHVKICKFVSTPQLRRSFLRIINNFFLVWWIFYDYRLLLPTIHHHDKRHFSILPTLFNKSNPHKIISPPSVKRAYWNMKVIYTQLLFFC